MTEKSFIKEIAGLVVKHPSDLFSSIAIAQACLESFFGRSDLAANANNYFGIKAGDSWSGDVYYKNTQEDDGKGNMSTIKAGFRKYKNMEESVRDHARFLTSTPWRSEYYKDVINAKTPELQAQALTGTYATDIRYKVKLMDLIDKYNLKKYDEGDNKMAISKPKIIDRRTKALGYPNRTSRTGNRRNHSQIKYIAWHYTATTNGSISGHENYWGRTLGWGIGGYTYYIDRKGNIYQNYDWAVRTNGVAGWNTPTLNISVEASNKNNYTDAQVKAREHLTLWLMDQLKVPASRVLGHKEFSGQATACPGYSASEMNAFRSQLAKLSKTKYNAPKATSKDPWTRIKSETGIFIAEYNIVRRDKPTVKANRTGQISAGDVIKYNGLFHADGYSWLEFKDGKGKYQYFPYRQHSEKESWGKLMSEEDYANKYVPKTKPKQDKEAEPKGLFKVQTGAFAQKENAEALAKKMEKDGYDTHIVKDK